MRVGLFPEPSLEFYGGGQHIDIRAGLASFGPLDQEARTSPKGIRIGLVGTSRTVEGAERWFRTISSGVPAKETAQPRLFPAFPGYGTGQPLPSEVLFDTRSTRTISYRSIQDVFKGHDQPRQVQDLTELLLEELRYLGERVPADVYLCALPEEVLRLMVSTEELEEESEEGETRSSDDRIRYDFHDFFKAQAMGLGRPTQLILPPTYGATISKKMRQLLSSSASERRLQDEATRAWNLYTALYYKAGGTPWRIYRDPSELSACFVGVSFFRTLDRKSVHTSLAEVFNERGQGVVVRGAEATTSKKDRQPHLTPGDAEALLAAALGAYRQEHHTLPARFVIHKTSRFTWGELEGFRSAIASNKIDYADYVEIQKGSLRLFRRGDYPPLRGTYLDSEGDEVFLYTRGSVPYFETYPGLYVPRTLRVRVEEAETTTIGLAREALALTKMNWNNTQFDGGDPITIRASRQVGRLLRYLDPNERIEPRYAFYM